MFISSPSYSSHYYDVPVRDKRPHDREVRRLESIYILQEGPSHTTYAPLKATYGKLSYSSREVSCTPLHGQDSWLHQINRLRTSPRQSRGGAHCPRDTYATCFTGPHKSSMWPSDKPNCLNSETQRDGPQSTQTGLPHTETHVLPHNLDIHRLVSHYSW